MALLPKQQQFLKQRLAEALTEQPRWADLRELLLAIGGAEVVARYEQDLEAILTRGAESDTAGALMRPAAHSRCHANAVRLWKRNPDNVIVTGYALSADDGLWRQHSWCQRERQVMETTSSRHAYFGFALNDDEAAAFASNNG